ncbi:MAG: phosphoribosylformylglycinamidine synthase [Clostridiales bacterium]|nr:phosphoribosylformylglycinamidine synthase [Clostridiales bacterium]
MVYRVYVERRPEYALEAARIKQDLRRNLQISSLREVRLYNRYDIEGIDEATLKAAEKTVFSEPQTEIVSDKIILSEDEVCFAVEYLPGQYDQRADSCEQCIQLITRGERPRVRTANVYVFSGIDENQLKRIKEYIINPIECREASLELPATLKTDFETPDEIETLHGFITSTEEELIAHIEEYSLAMDREDLIFCREYFRSEGRDPTITEIRLIDAYWSDHCRHTTFLTEIEKVSFEDEYIEETFKEYLAHREQVYAGKRRPITLMDLATVAAKYLKSKGMLKNLDESEEINACSIKIKVDVDGEEQDWLLMFKNETHNHPTEIEPFGGAATCLGGAIRDPLSGRSYVYQAMRVTGAADPRTPIENTLPGKLPQAKITLGAAAGYSSYGNQIGLATGGVYEHYHPDYVAKRLEIGAVVGAAPAENVVRKRPEPGDVVILLGGRTGRDGCGGATGSSKAHTAESLTSCGAEVQKGNPPEERKLQRLFRNPDATRLIKRCNDFGAGGVSVAIGELADGLEIDLSRIPKKYEGLDGTELAISESQERMAVVTSAEDAETFRALADEENLEATVVAEVRAEPRLVMKWKNMTIVNLSREFLNSNGAPKYTEIEVVKAEDTDILAGFAKTLDINEESDISSACHTLLSDLNACSKRGLGERFDSTVGAATVVMPFGGKNQITPPQYMAAKLPLLKGETDTASYMAYGFDPYLSKQSPYHGAMYAVIESVARLVAAGVDYKDAYLTFQEYFERTKNDPRRWGKPMAALLGAYRAQTALGLAAIGGKDSMSGTFEDIDVPPTLVSFAIAPGKASGAVTPEFKAPGNKVYRLSPRYTENGPPVFSDLCEIFEYIHSLTGAGIATSVYAVGCGGVVEAVAKMCFGNGIGFSYSPDLCIKTLFERRYGSFVVEATEKIRGEYLGRTTDNPFITIKGEEIPLSSLKKAWEETLEPIFPTKTEGEKTANIPAYSCHSRPRAQSVNAERFAAPRALIAVFPGTNCEYDTARAFERAGAAADIFVFRNITAQALEESINALAERISNSQILMLPGGFSGGDEPNGSGKFITAVLRNPKIKEAVTELIEHRDGLVLGICNGFQALLKSGLLPYGKIADSLTPDSPTLTYNTIGRHQSRMVHTRIASVKSPWLAGVNVGDIHTIPISHGEGRFVAREELIAELAENGQIAAQYVTPEGKPTMEDGYNPNGSVHAIEAIISPDGRILGKMGHSERIDSNLYRNIPGNHEQHIFQSGVAYFK